MMGSVKYETLLEMPYAELCEFATDLIKAQPPNQSAAQHELINVEGSEE
jgi:hypothetical protein